MSHQLYTADNISVFWSIEKYTNTETNNWWWESSIILDFAIFINGKMKTWSISILLDVNNEPVEYYSWNTLTSLLFSLGYNLWDDHTELHANWVIRKYISRILPN